MGAYGCFAQVYDRLTENIDYNELASYYDRLIARHSGKKGILLDLACGTGSISRIMSKMGYDVIGTDLSYDMLSVAMSQPHENIEYLCQDMRSLDMYGTIDATICVLDSINHLESKEDILQCFKSVSLFCDPEGVFIFDMNTVKKHGETLADNTYVYDLDDIYCVWQNYYQDDENARVDIALDIFTQNTDGSYDRMYEEFSEIALAIAEVEKLLTEAGFEVKEVLEYLTDNKGTEDCQKVVFCCTKTKER